MSSFTVLLWSHWLYRCRQWHVRSNPQQRISDHLFSPSGDHKILTRICANLHGLALWYAGFCCVLPLLSSLLLSVPSLCVALHLPGHLSSDSLSRAKGRWKCGNAEFTDLKSAAATITHRRVGACWVEPQLLLWLSCSLSPVTVRPELLIRSSWEWLSMYERNILNRNITFFFSCVLHVNCWMTFLCSSGNGVRILMSSGIISILF